MITHVAIKDSTGEIWKMPKPYRHHHILKLIYDHFGESGHDRQQGFISNGKFVSRIEAKYIAEQNYQIKLGCGKFRELFSEDLW